MLPGLLFGSLIIGNDDGDKLGEAEAIADRDRGKVANAGGLRVVQFDPLDRGLVAAEVDDVAASAMDRQPAVGGDRAKIVGEERAALEWAFLLRSRRNSPKPGRSFLS